MRAALFDRVGRPLSVETVPDPEPRPGQVIVQVARAGICGSDLHWTETPGILEAGMILGHEFAGTVVDPNGSGIPSGTAVTALPLLPCWECGECGGGHLIHCGVSGKIGLNRPGAFAQALAVDAKLVQRLPSGVDFEQGALIEPLAVAYRALRHAADVRHARILVMGGGPIGLAVTMGARLGGAASVVVSEPNAARREMATAVGAHAVVDPRREDIAAVFAASTGGSPDIVIDCVGLPGTFGQAVGLVRRRGQIVCVGVCYSLDSFLPFEALRKEVTVRFSSAYELQDFEAVSTSLAIRGMAPEPLVTNRVSLAQLPEALETLRVATDQCKVIVEID